MTTPPTLTVAEFGIMKVMWRLGAATVADVRAELARGGTELAYTTVLTLMGRLAGKAAVHVDRAREPFMYTAAYRQESALRDRLRQFVADVFDGQPASLVMRLVEDEELSLEDLREIERRLDGRAAAAEPARPPGKRARKGGTR